MPPGFYFGHSVAVSGKTAIVGAYETNSAHGMAYIYVKGASGWPTTPTVTLTDPAATEDDVFGISVAVSGKTAIIGAYGTNGFAGAAYIYVEGASGWPTTPTATLLDPGSAANDLFGYSVAVSGKTAIVGTPQNSSSKPGVAYVYVRGPSGWPTTPTITLSDPAQTANDFFGGSVAVSGRTLAVGAPQATGYDGAAYIYAKGASNWPTVPTTTLSDPGAMANDYFGSSVALSGMTAVVGAHQTAPHTGAAYIYMKSVSGWPTAPTTALSDPAAGAQDAFGFSVSTSGKTIAVGAPQTRGFVGAAYIYVKGASGWPLGPNLTLSDPDMTTAPQDFGYSVAVSGTSTIIGAPNTPRVDSTDGAAYIYKP